MLRTYCSLAPICDRRPIAWAALNGSSEGRVISFSGQFRSPALKGDVITCSATVTTVTENGGRARVELDLNAQNQRGDKLMPGKAVVEIS